MSRMPGSVAVTLPSAGQGDLGANRATSRATDPRGRLSAGPAQQYPVNAAGA